MAKRAAPDLTVERSAKKSKLLGGTTGGAATSHSDDRGSPVNQVGAKPQTESESFEAGVNAVDEGSSTRTQVDGNSNNVNLTTNKLPSVLSNTTTSTAVQAEPKAKPPLIPASGTPVQQPDKTSGDAHRATVAAPSLSSDSGIGDPNQKTSFVQIDAQTVRPDQSTGKAFPDPNMVEDIFRNFWTKPYSEYSAVIAGITNPGSLCYRNAVLMALLCSPNFIHYLYGWFMESEAEQFQGNQVHILTWLHKLHGLAIDEPTHKDFHKAVQVVWKQIGFPGPKQASLDDVLPSGPWSENSGCEGGSSSQQDVGAFLLWLYEAVKGQMETLDPADYSAKLNWLWVSNARLVTHSRCPNCPNLLIRGDNIDEYPVIDLQIPALTTKVPEGYVRDTLEYLLACSLHSTVTVDCPNCKKKRVARTKRSKRFQHAPPVLTLRIERGIDAQESTKDKTPLRLPKILDISKWLNEHQYGKGSKIQYKLSAIIVHKGESIRSGHYICYRAPQKKEGKLWTEINDALVQPGVYMDAFDSKYVSGSKKSNNSETPYILIYDRMFDRDDIRPGRKLDNIRDWDMENDQTTSTIAKNGQMAAMSAEKSAVKKTGTSLSQPAIVVVPNGSQQIVDAAGRIAERSLNEQKSIAPEEQKKSDDGIEQDTITLAIQVDGEDEEDQDRESQTSSHQYSELILETTPITSNAAPVALNAVSSTTASHVSTAVEKPTGAAPSHADPTTVKLVTPVTNDPATTASTPGSATTLPQQAVAVPPIAPTPTSFTLSGPSGDQGHPSATVNMTLKIGEIVFPIPQFIIDHIDPR